MIHPAYDHLPFGGRGITAVSSAILVTSSRTARKSSPRLLLNAPGTFSQTMYRGFPYFFRISFTILICSINSPERAPDSPARFPATLKSWQGEPPIMQSTGSISSPRISVMSPKCFTSYLPAISAAQENRQLNPAAEALRPARALLMFCGHAPVAFAASRMEL